VKQKNKELRRLQLIKAVGTLLASEGITALGVNAVAKEAQCDKVLIYRYFGGLDGLIQAYAKEGDFWPSVEELCGYDMDSFLKLDFIQRATTVSKNYLYAIRKRPLTLEILRWEMVQQSILTQALDNQREEVSRKLIPMLIDPSQENTNYFTLSTIITSAINYLSCRSRDTQFFNGIDIQSKEGWDLLEESINTMIIKVLS